MSLSEKAIKEFQEIFKKEYGKELTHEEAAEAGRTLLNLYEIVLDGHVAELKLKERLKNSPKGFSLMDGHFYNCGICHTQIKDEQLWYDKWGKKCLACQDAVDKKKIPGNICYQDEKFYAVWEFGMYFQMKSPTVKKLIRQGILKAHTVPKSGFQVMLLKENADVLPPKDLVKHVSIPVKGKERTITITPWYEVKDPKEQLKGYKILDYISIQYEKKPETGYNEVNEIHMEIFERVKKLNLPLGKYVVVGSGPMVAREMRDFTDIDILVTPDLFDELFQKEGWEISTGEAGRKVLKNGAFEIDKVFWCKDYQPDTNELIKNAEMINGIPFLPLSELIKFKEQLGRRKDFKDIELIEKYMKDSKNSPIQMKLQEKPFNLIKEGCKIIELRLHDEKRKNIRIGDIIEFSKLPDLAEKVKVEVTDLLVYKTFAELIENVPAKDLSYTDSDKEDLKAAMYKIYTKEDEEKYGVLGIRIRLI